MRGKFLIVIAGLSAALGSCQREVEKDVVKTAYIHKFGVRISGDEWAERGQSGQVISSLTNGVSLKRTYRNGVLHGPTTYSFPHSQSVEKEEIYEAGSLLQETVYYSSGMPKEQKKYTDEGLEVFTWYEMGVPKSVELYQDRELLQGEYFTLNNDVDSSVDHGNGTKTVRDQFGHLVAQETFKEGYKILETTYYPQGMPSAVTPYLDGIVQGQRKTFYPTGEPKTLETWQHGVQQGITISFKNGLKYAETAYVKGKKQGIEKIFRDGLILAEEINWQNDQKHGPSKIFVEDQVKVSWFKHGKPTTKSGFLQGDV
ncbi:MAG: hypothetical protein K0S07_799 [Chlamydiales bacterium]|nr:hypothetical protein [Chlamydiales bacterium]